MLSEQIRAIGILANVIIRASIRMKEEQQEDAGPMDLVAIADTALTSSEFDEIPVGFLRRPIDPETVQVAVRLAEQMLATLAEVDAKGAAAEAESDRSDGNWADDTGPHTVPKWRRSRFNRGRIWRAGTELCVPGEDRDMVRVRGVQFESGAAYIGLMANAGRSGHRPECYFGAAAAREVASALLEWAHVLDPSVTPKTQRRRARRIEARGNAVTEASDVRTDAA